jgi:hypothetical protein
VRLKEGLWVVEGYLKQVKYHFSFYIFSFFLYKIGEQEGGTDPVVGKMWYQ